MTYLNPPETPTEALEPYAPYRSPRNGVGVAALVVGVVAATLSLIPFAIFGTWLLALAALVLGIIGLALADRPRRAAGWGLALSIIAGVIGMTSTAVAIGAATTPGPATVTQTTLEDGAPPAAEQPVADQPAPEQVPVQEQTAPPAAQQPAPVAEQPAPAEQQPTLPIGQRNAVDKARSYLAVTSFSRTGLIKQLEYEGFSNSDASFAVDHVSPDWNAQAALKAESYLKVTSFSRQGLLDQLLYEGFSQDQATHGVSAVGY